MTIYIYIYIYLYIYTRYPFRKPGDEPDTSPDDRMPHLSLEDVLNPFRTAVPFWAQVT